MTERDRTEFFYPDDVLVATDGNGKRTARIGYDLNKTGQGFEFVSHLPIAFDAQDMVILVTTIHKFWLKAREAYRAERRESALQNYPAVLLERQSWRDYVAAGNEPSITAWRASMEASR